MHSILEAHETNGPLEGLMIRWESNIKRDLKKCKVYNWIYLALGRVWLLNLVMYILLPKMPMKFFHSSAGVRFSR
jgi:hypothetical protein